MTDSEVARAFIDQIVTLIRGDLLPKLEKAVQLLDPNELWWKPNARSNSVGNLILHLGGNVRQWITCGLGGRTDDRQRDLEFSEVGPIRADELLARLGHEVDSAAGVLRSFDQAHLLRTYAIQACEVTALQAMLHVAEHFSHHTGQVLYIVKMLKDRDLRFYDL